MVTIAKMPKYASYIDSGIPLIGKIPEFWKVNRLKVCLKRKITDGPHETPLFLEDGVPFLSVDGIQDGNLLFEGCRFVSKEAHEQYSKKCLVEKNDILMGKAASTGKIARVKVDFPFSIWSPLALIKINPKIASPKFVEYALKSESSQIQIDHLCTSNTQKNISMDDIPKIRLCLPPIIEQMAIAEFLDKRTTQIDEAIKIKEQQIGLLKERKQIVIQRAVTQGLDQNVPMKDSKIDWIGNIPEHWEVKRAKYIFNEVDERSKTGDEELLSVSHMTGVTPRSEKNVNMFLAEDYSGSKLCRENDLVINIMWAWMGALGVSSQVGIVSPSYGVFRQKVKNTFNPIYLEYLLKSTKYIEYYNKVSTGLHSSRLRFYGHMLFAMKMGYPPIDEQNKIISYLDEQTKLIDEAVKVQDEQIVKLTEFKTSLIHDAVTGKIKVMPEMVED
ncbi:TPA: restriction endonuclease subunit S [Vibrio alginolyticus]